MRAKPEDELEGLDIPEMGVLGYPDTQIVRNELDYSSADNAEIKQLARFKSSKLLDKLYQKPAATATVDQAVPVQVISQPPAAMASDIKLTHITIITKQSKFEALKAAMNKIGVTA